jgi:hypothetical protein
MANRCCGLGRTSRALGPTLVVVGCAAAAGIGLAQQPPQIGIAPVTVSDQPRLRHRRTASAEGRGRVEGPRAPVCGRGVAERRRAGHGTRQGTADRGVRPSAGNGVLDPGPVAGAGDAGFRGGCRRSPSIRSSPRTVSVPPITRLASRARRHPTGRAPSRGRGAGATAGGSPTSRSCLPATGGWRPAAPASRSGQAASST